MILVAGMKIQLMKARKVKITFAKGSSIRLVFPVLI